jgi:protein-tyrosine phosphatase
MVDANPWPRPWGPPIRPGARPDFSVILPDLLVGQYPTPADASWLRHEHGVHTVVNLQDDGDLNSKGLRSVDLEAAYALNEISYHRLPITDCDNEMLRARLADSVRTIDHSIRRSQRVYLHCNAGMNRAPTIAIAYLHMHHDMSLVEARQFFKQRRHCVPYMTVLDEYFASSPRLPR